ncbi:hypothetical protein COOONC_22211, partial [Cooperia oncophora]
SIGSPVSDPSPSKKSRVEEAPQSSNLSPIELLTLLFEEQEKRVLELVLDGCGGDVLQTIQHFASVRKLRKHSFMKSCAMQNESPFARLSMTGPCSRASFSMESLLQRPMFPPYPWAPFLPLMTPVSQQRSDASLSPENSSLSNE